MPSCIIRSLWAQVTKISIMSEVIDSNQLMNRACPAAACEWKSAADMCSRTSLLPSGVERVADLALASTPLLPDAPDASTSEKAVIAAFDFDGTCISASSPTRLVGVLGKSFQLNPWKLFRVGLWALAYKLNFSHKDAFAVRERVFTAFKGKNAVEVNDFLCRFYHEKVAPYYRSAADAEMIAHLEAGHVVVLVSATFEPIIAAAMVDHPIQFSISSRMKIDASGNYTNTVDGLPVEGPDKMIVLREFADRYFGVGKWEIGWAYGDHYSDLEMLESAAHPCAVTPDNKLARVAAERGWEVFNWD